MKISTKGRYAVRLMLDIAAHTENGNASLKECAKRQGLSLKYLEQIASTLSRAGFIKSYRGSLGGYRLTRSPGEYTVRDILVVTEGGLAPVACLDDEINQCPRAGICKTLPLWQGLYDVIDAYLSSVTLADLM